MVQDKKGNGSHSSQEGIDTENGTWDEMLPLTDDLKKKSGMTTERDGHVRNTRTTYHIGD